MGKDPHDNLKVFEHLFQPLPSFAALNPSDHQDSTTRAVIFDVFVGPNLNGNGYVVAYRFSPVRSTGCILRTCLAIFIDYVDPDDDPPRAGGVFDSLQ